MRAAPNQNTTAGDELWDRLVHSEPLDAVEFTVPAAPGRPARWVRQTLYREQVTLPALTGAPAVTVTAILARAEHPPAGEKVIEWRLLTNRVAETLEHVVEQRRLNYLANVTFGGKCDGSWLMRSRVCKLLIFRLSSKRC